MTALLWPLSGPGGVAQLFSFSAGETALDSSSGGAYMTVRAPSLSPPFMRFTPPAGTYFVVFSGYGFTSTAGRTAFFAIGVDGTEILSSERRIEHLVDTPFCCTAEIALDGTEQVQARFKGQTGGGPPGNTSVLARQLYLVKTA